MKIFNINSNTNFQRLKTYNQNGITLFDNFSCRTNDLKKYSVDIYERNNDNYDIVVFNKKREVPAKLEFKIYDDSLFINAMSTEKIHQGKGLGTILHLASVIEMLENNFNDVKLFSTAPAITFHSKFGFYPAEDWCECLCKNVKKIAELKDPKCSHLSKNAKLLLQMDIPSSKKTVIGNRIIYDYLNYIFSLKNNAELQKEFEYGSDMKLNKSDIIQDKDYYNKLFEQYHIDYQI